MQVAGRPASGRRLGVKQHVPGRARLARPGRCAHAMNRPGVVVATSPRPSRRRCSSKYSGLVRSMVGSVSTVLVPAVIDFEGRMAGVSHRK